MKNLKNTANLKAELSTFFYNIPCSKSGLLGLLLTACCRSLAKYLHAFKVLDHFYINAL